MNEFDREYHVARIIAGGSTLKVNGVRYRIVPPTKFARLEAAEIQREAVRDAEIQGLYHNRDIHDLLIFRGIWSREGQKRIDQLRLLIDELKINLYKDRDEALAESHRIGLDDARQELSRLEACKHQHDHFSVETYARSAKARYLTGTSLLQADGSPYWTDPDEGWNRPDVVLEAAMSKIAADQLDMAQIRLLARSDEWNGVWNTRQGGSSLFGMAAVDLTDEQRTLASWATAYENITSRPDAPSKSVIEDDDMLDGWMLIEKQKRESEDLETQFNNIVGEEVRGKQEIFMIMDPKAKRGTLKNSPQLLHSLNDDQAKNQKDQRLAYLKKNGVVAEADMPDTRLNNQMAGAKITRG